MTDSHDIPLKNNSPLTSLFTIVRNQKVDSDLLKYLILCAPLFFALYNILKLLFKKKVTMVVKNTNLVIRSAEMNHLQLNKIHSNHQNRTVDNNIKSAFIFDGLSDIWMKDTVIKEIVIPTSHDILCGRLDVGTCNHVGNKHWRALVKQNISWYMSMPENYKMEVAEVLVQEVQSQYPPGRFLQEDSGTGLWLEIDDQKAKKMALRALEVARDLHLGMAKCPNHSPPSMWDIVNLTNHDVLFGYEEESNHNHEGNKYWRSWVYSEKRRYAAAKKESDKWRVANRIVQELRSQNPPGRFLEKRPGRKYLWFDIGDFKAIEKTLQALQEAPDLRLRPYRRRFSL